MSKCVQVAVALAIILTAPRLAAGQDITVPDNTNQTINTPINLTGNIIITVGTNSLLTITGGITDDGNARGITKRGPGTVRFNSAVNNTYTGLTRVEDGVLELQNTGGTTAIAGPLELGVTSFLGGCANGICQAKLLAADQIADGVTVTVQRDGTFDVNGQTETIQTLDVAGGLAQLGAGATGRLTVTGDITLRRGGANLAAQRNGRIVTGAAGSEVVLNGNLQGSSLPVTSGGAASISGAGRLFLNGPTHTFVDELNADVVVAGTVGASIAHTATVDTYNALTLTRDNTYTGTTTVVGGVVRVLGSQPQSAVNLAGVPPVGVLPPALEGTGTVGSITSTGAGSTVAIAPGPTQGTFTSGILHSGAVNLATDATLSIDIFGKSAGSGYDQLDVTGGVSLGNATLKVTLTIQPVAGDEFLIVKNDGADAVLGTFAGLPEGAIVPGDGPDRLAITYHGGDGNDIVLTLVPLQTTYYLAEGATGSFFDEDLLIANPSTVTAPVTLTFLLDGGGTIVAHRTVPAQSRITVRVDEIPGLEQTAASVRVDSDNHVDVVVERTMFWDPTHYAGHTASAVRQPELTWTFAEGSQGFFDTYLLIANPNALNTTVTVTFFRELDTPVVRTFPMAPLSRLTVYAGSIPELLNRSFGIDVSSTQPVIAERAMYFATTPTRLWSGGTANMGSPVPLTGWFFAEGSTGPFFNTFMLLSNPQTMEVSVNFTYLLSTGETVSRQHTIGPRQRLTVNVADEGHANLANSAVSTVVTCGFPIVAERSMYWPGNATPFGEGHNSSGATRTSVRWGLAEGRLGLAEQFSTYILLANREDTAANVDVTFLREHGPAVTRSYVVPPHTRFTVDASTVTELRNETFGARIVSTNDVPIVVERSMYWNANGVFFAGGTNALATVIQ